MRLTQITVARTYNTGNYTSQRFEVHADLESEDDFGHSLQSLADDLDYQATKVLQLQKARAESQDAREIPF